ncbi:hypothetical protein KY285_001130 [Solanum tuberosum]|nr:hypothetical protein KY285_001130 [Solanum tuberosum]
MLSVHGRYDRKLIVLNKAGQPVGPSNDVVIELSSFLGTLARNATLCPLDIENWKLLDTKQDLWDYTKKYDIPEIGNRWTLKTIQEAWRRRKFDLKTLHFDAYANDQIRMEKKPDDVPTSQFKELLKYWNSEKFQVSLTSCCSLSASSPGANSSKCLLAAKLSSSVYTVIAIFFKLFPDRFGS